MSTAGPVNERVDWVDYAKGFCIVFVVMMHSTLGVGLAAGHEGFLHYVVAFAKPFRMPDFFLISGLFLARVIDRDWRTYLDRKVVHFAYFYALWVTIQFAVKAPGMAAEVGGAGVLVEYLLAFVQPFGTLWFIYLLPVFFVVIKLARRVPAPLMWLVGAALESAHLDTGVYVADYFAHYFVYIYTGYLLAPRIFALTAWVQKNPALGMSGLIVWGLLEYFAVFHGYSELPAISLALGLVGACAVVTVASLLAKSDLFAPLRYCGRNSIVIYLAFFLPMALSRTLLLKQGLITDIGWISVIVTLCGIVFSLALFWAVRGTRLKFLFQRPAPFRLTEKPRLALQPAE
jgi:uncharacterized membrane protein YcfT